jgi:hypothetical protein
MLLLAALLLIGAPPADCPIASTQGPMLPLSLDLPGKNGRAHVAVPMAAPGMACQNESSPPVDVLGGEPGDLLRGPANPRVEVEVLH